MSLRASIALAVIIAVTVTTGAVATGPEQAYERMAHIADQLDCPVCQGQSVKESNAHLARQMREIIDQKIAGGASDDEIFDFFVDRYGEGILRDPPKQGLALGVWIGPIVAAAIGVVAVALVLMRRHPRPSAEPAAHLGDLEAQVDRLRRVRGDDHT